MTTTLYYIVRYGRVLGPWLQQEVTEYLLPGDKLVAINAEDIAP